MKKYRSAIVLFVVFEAIAVSLWLATGNLFYLLNFTYIGTCLGVGLALKAAGWHYAREFIQFGVGAYMLVFLGLICRENMQIEGFWYYLLSGVVGAGVLHYAIAKIFGPLLFGRGWCGYCCWTAMVLDLLPYRQPRGPRRKIGFVRYIVFTLSLVLVLLLFHYGKATSHTMFVLFVAGNLAYYAFGIVLAVLLKDNRAFCKYVCPVTVFLKPMSRYALLRIHCDEEKCIHCGKCLEVCPMEVEVNNNSRQRRNATECILCHRCTRECPVKALR
ncbi:MAG: 4Fe-4S binding protein [Bacteroidales bacterium]|nr:4Fe-4S binding protein [Bacteroidales bacterium]